MTPSRLRGPGVLVALAAAVALAIGAVSIVRATRGIDLPDPAAVERRLEAAVAAGDPLRTVIVRFQNDGYACAETDSATGAWHCDLAEDDGTDELDCPMRIMVALLPNETGRLGRYAVSKGAYCM